MHILNYENDVIVYTSSRIRRANVGSHPIIFKNIRFGPFTVKRYPRVFKLKRSLRCFQKSPFLRVENVGIGVTVAKVMRFEMKMD